MTSLEALHQWQVAADAGYSSFDEMQRDARLRRAEQLLRERREAAERRHRIEVILRREAAARQAEVKRQNRRKEQFKNVIAILAFIAAILLLWQCGAFGAQRTREHEQLRRQYPGSTVADNGNGTYLILTPRRPAQQRSVNPYYYPPYPYPYYAPYRPPQQWRGWRR